MDHPAGRVNYHLPGRRPLPHRLWSRGAGIAAAGLLMLASPGFAQDPTLEKVERELVHLLEKVGPAVVTVTTAGEAGDPGSADREEEAFRWHLPWKGHVESHLRLEFRSTSTGVVLDGQGHILTTPPRGRRGQEYLVTLPSGQRQKAHLVGVDDITGIAVLRVDAPLPPPPPINAGRHLDPGSLAVVVDRASGTIPDIRLAIVGGEDRYLQLASYQGESGAAGPVFDIRGTMVGFLPPGEPRHLAWLGEMGRGPEGAIPAGTLTEVASALIATGRVPRGWLGVTIRQEPTEAAPEGSGPGVTITKVVEDSPAERAGIRTGDLLIRYGDAAIQSSDDLVERVLSSRSGTRVQVTLRRGGRELVLPVSIEERPAGVEGRVERILLPRTYEEVLRADSRTRELRARIAALKEELLALEGDLKALEP